MQNNLFIGDCPLCSYGSCGFGVCGCNYGYYSDPNTTACGPFISNPLSFTVNVGNEMYMASEYGTLFTGDFTSNFEIPYTFELVDFPRQFADDIVFDAVTGKKIFIYGNAQGRSRGIMPHLGNTKILCYAQLPNMEKVAQKVLQLKFNLITMQNILVTLTPKW
jgi:hypothetical protein